MAIEQFFVQSSLYITYTFAERPNTKTGTFQKCGDFQRKVYAMFYHSVALPVSTFGYASTSY